MAHRPTFIAADYEVRLRALAAKGKTRTAVATALKIPYKATKRMAGELGIVLRKGKPGGSKKHPLADWRQRLHQMSERELAIDPVARWS